MSSRIAAQLLRRLELLSLAGDGDFLKPWATASRVLARSANAFEQILRRIPDPKEAVQALLDLARQDEKERTKKTSSEAAGAAESAEELTAPLKIEQRTEQEGTIRGGCVKVHCGAPAKSSHLRGEGVDERRTQGRTGTLPCSRAQNCCTRAPLRRGGCASCHEGRRCHGRVFQAACCRSAGGLVVVDGGGSGASSRRGACLERWQQRSRRRAPAIAGAP